MKGKADKIKVAAVQTSPVFLNKKLTVEKVCDLINKAAKKGAKLVVFPETFIPAYPDWVWTVPNSKKAMWNELYSELVKNSISIPDESTKKICNAAKKNKVVVAIGVNERNAEASGSSLYNTLLFIDDKGNIPGRHRKLVPTGGERLIWAQGDGKSLNVYDTSIGKIGGLICWENFMPLARTALYLKGVQIYVAPTWDSSDAWRLSLQHIAREGGMYVIGCCQALQKRDIPAKYEFKKLYPAEKDWINKGNSVIIDPNGKIIAGPLTAKKDILYAEIDLNEIAKAKWIFDSAGHYARPDVFEFSISSEK